ncbi:MAG: hypothetical protein K2X47_10105 [Bdellovibrionales bacterium]|nr:hypothetical protein [Bdellovibrionales bacterium]
MIGRLKQQPRGMQILKILGEHGSLSVRGLSEIVKPAMARRKLQECLQRLTQKRYVTKRNDTLFGGTAVFYQLTSDKLLLAQIALITDMDLEKFPPPKIWSAELLHSESCAVLCEKLKPEFPSWKVIREFHFHHYPRIKNILLESDPDTRESPDMLMSLKIASGRPSINVAVEVERTQKSERRIREKLHKYASESRLDGVIYFCEDDSIGNRLRLIYKSKISERNLRIRGASQVLDGSTSWTQVTPKLYV